MKRLMLAFAVALAAFQAAGGGVLCRTAGKDNREHCSKVAAGGAATMKFFKQNGEFRYEATVLVGNQLAK